jgi:hypothetical protein
MRTRLISAVTLLALLAVGCGGTQFTAEKTVLTTVTKAIETFTAGVNDADSPTALASVLKTFSASVEKVLPAMNKLTGEHPEWENNPPDALKDTMAGFKKASEGLQGAMPKVMQMASQYADNQQLKDAIDKFKSVVSQL